MAGECHAPISVGEGRVVVADHDGQRDYWRCFDAADGRPRWVYEYPNAEKMEYGAGPRAAPLIDGGKVFCLNAWGELFCLGMADGRVAWKKHLAKDFGQKTPTWGYTASPLIADGKLLVSPGGNGGPVAALDPRDRRGALDGCRPRPELCQSDRAHLRRRRAGGRLRRTRPPAPGTCRPAGGCGRVPIESAAGYVVPSPVAVHGRLLLTSDQQGARLFSFGSGGAIEPQPAAVNEDVAPDVSTPTVWGDAVLCASAGLVLVDASPAQPEGLLKTLWVYDAEDCVEGICHAIVSQDRALVMCEDGQVLLLAADRDACRILDRRKLCDKTWVHPALAGGRFYVRDRNRLYCYEMPAGS